jgi:hypothetical protein
MKPRLPSLRIKVWVVGVLAIFLLETLSADARSPQFRMGDWSSSGSTRLPYEPAYDFEYSCQLQMSDQIFRRDQVGDTYRLFAIGDFSFDNKKTAINTSELKWIAKRLYGSEARDSQEPLPFETAGSLVSVAFEPSHPLNDTLFLNLELRQFFGEWIVSARELVRFSREKTRFEASVYIDVKNTQRKETPQMMMRVLCDKIK